MTAGNLRAGRTAEWPDTEPLKEEGAPALWNPAAAGCWSLLFTPAFGAVLHMKNWQAMGDEEKAGQAKTWVIISLVMLAALLVASMVLPESRKFDQVARSVNIGLLMAWYVTAARVQQKLVKERFGKVYPRRGWAKPIGLAVLAIFGLFGMLMVAAVVFGV